MKNQWLSDHLPTAGTFSKSPLAWGLPPDFTIRRVDGAYAVCSDGQKRLDWTSALGQNLLGQTDSFKAWLRWKVGDGLCATLPHLYEAECAERLALLLGCNVPGWVPADVGVRFCKSGSDATTMAVRLARAVTGRDRVLCFHNHYHGWHSWTIGRQPPAWGVVEDEKRDIGEVTWDDPFSFSCLGETAKFYAAVIFEHPAVDAPPEWYESLLRFCDDNKVLLIADEVVTGLRYGLGGACQRYKLMPDIVCMGKGLGNGAAVAAVAAVNGLMTWFARTDPVFASGTTWGNPLDLAACRFVLENWKESDVSALWELGDRLVAGLREAGWDVFGHGARSVLRFGSPEERAFFVHGMFERGFMLNRPNFPNAAMTAADVNATVAAAQEVRELFRLLGPETLAKATTGKIGRVLFEGR